MSDWFLDNKTRIATVKSCLAWSYDIKITACQQKRRRSQSTASRPKEKFILFNLLQLLHSHFSHDVAQKAQ